MCHSVGRQPDLAPPRVTRLAARSMVKSAVSTTASSSRGCRPAQRRPQPREQLVHAERLRDVVVGAGVEGLDLVRLALADGEDDDRHARPAAQAADHVDAVDPRQAEVEDHEVGVLARRERQRLPRRSARASTS